MEQGALFRVRSTRMIACNMAASLYEPINVYKPVAPNIGIVDGPFEYLTVGGVTIPLPFTTRMTVVHLSNDMRLPLLLQRKKAEAAIEKIHSWQPQRILLSHGRCFDADADIVIRRIFG
jgi:hypothetical protein